MNWENYSRRQLLLLVLVINFTGWALIISGLIGLYYLIVWA